jgi:putative glutamine amidotransferase
LCGGAFDIPPAWYGQTPRARIDPPREARSRLERALLVAAEARGLAVLGICNGAQLLAVHRGGALVQDLRSERPGALDHERGAERTRVVHAVEIAPGSRLAALLAAREIGVNSSHHQSIDRPGRNVSVVGRAPDGVVEAIEDPDLTFWVGVQWHPERLRDAASRALFDAFAAASRGVRARRG